MFDEFCYRARLQLAKMFQVWYLFDYFLEGQSMCNARKFEARQVCDTLRFSGLHPRYTDAFNEFITLPGKME